MTRLQLLLVAVLSVLSTAGVLVGAVGASPDLGAAGDLTRQVRVATGTGPAVETQEPATEETTAEEPSTASEEPAAAVATDAVDDTTSETADVDVDVDPADFDDTPDDAGTTTAADTAPRPSKVKHIFVITLSGQGFDAAFGASPAVPYLATELRAKGTLLAGYTSLGRADLPDRLALVSGQPPNASTRGNCATYKEIPSKTEPNGAGEITADGCVYPNTVTTLADQVTSAGQIWRAYSEDLEKGPAGAAPCRRPASNAVDDTQTARPGDGYAARLTPFVYFHSLLDLSDCEANAGPLTTLAADLAAVKKTPTLSWIAPNLCNAGADPACGLAAADGFLKAWVPKILAAPAFKKDGLLIVTLAGASGAAEDTPTRTGTLLVSPFAQAGGTDDTAHDPYSLLRTIEDLLGYKPLARAKKAPSLTTTVLAGARDIQPGDD